MSGNSREAGRTTSSRVLALLGAFSTCQRFLTLSELSRCSGLPLTTTHRLVGDLVEWGALERVGDHRFTVGLRLWEVGCLAPRQRDLRSVALPFMQDLYAATHENVLLAVREGKQVLYLEKISGDRSVTTMTAVGARLPLHATGPGKIILAFSGPQLLRSVIDDGLCQFTPYTVTMPGRLAEALCRVRETQIAYSLEEMALGSSAVAAPIFGQHGALHASLALAVRSSTDLGRLVPAVRTAALGVTRRMADLDNTGKPLNGHPPTARSRS